MDVNCQWKSETIYTSVKRHRVYQTLPPFTNAEGIRRYRGHTHLDEEQEEINLLLSSMPRYPHPSAAPKRESSNCPIYRTLFRASLASRRTWNQAEHLSNGTRHPSAAKASSSRASRQRRRERITASPAPLWVRLSLPAAEPQLNAGEGPEPAMTLREWVSIVCGLFIKNHHGSLRPWGVGGVETGLVAKEIPCPWRPAWARLRLFCQAVTLWQAVRLRCSQSILGLWAGDCSCAPSSLTSRAASILGCLCTLA